MSLRDLEPDGGTSLTDAMIDGVKQLQNYNCIKYNIIVYESAHYHRLYTLHIRVGNTASHAL